jgi:pimeloyl-ACP methyl ester carboxylesterase
MAAQTSQEEQKRRRRKLLIRGLLLGGAAVGVPALANALIARRSKRLRSAAWGRTHRFAWRLGEISFQRLGEGPALLLLHSFGPGHDSEEWRQVAEILSDQFQVFAVDLIGWGRSDRPQLHYDDELYIQLAVDFIEDVVRERVVPVAAGLAGAYALQVAVDHPESVRGVALSVPSGVNIYGDEPDLKDALVHRLLRTPVLGTSALNLYTSHTSIARYLKRDVYAAPDRVDAALVERHYHSSHQPGSHNPLAAYLSGYLNHRVEEALARLDCPIWIGWGRQALNPPVETADLWLRHAASSIELDVFEDSGNLPHVEAAPEFAERVQSFLATLPD